MSDSGPVAAENEDFLTAEDRAEIERELEEMVAREARDARPEPLERRFSQPRRSGITLPIVTWVVAVALGAGGYFGLQYIFDQREETITLESRTYFGTEAQLIEEILRESERRLAEKDQEIDSIQDQLSLITAEREQLEENLASELEEREAELRTRLQAELSDEQTRLSEQGLSESEIQARLETLQTEREEEIAARLAELQQQAEAQLEAAQEELAAQRSALEASLNESRAERAALAEDAQARAAEAAAREAELRAELDAEIAELEESEQRAFQQIQELQQRRETEALLTDQILGSFAVIVSDIEQGMIEQAVEGLDSLEELLLSREAAEESERDRRRTEMALASTLRSLVQEVAVLRQNIALRSLTETDTETAEIERQRASELIETAAEVVALAEVARGEGRFTEARSLYQQALATIPSLERVYPGILDLEASRRALSLDTTVAEGEEFLQQEATPAAVNAYTQGLRSIAATEEDPLLAVADGVTRAFEQAQDELLDSLETTQAELQAQLQETEAQNAQLARQLRAERAEAATLAEENESLRSDLAVLETRRDETAETASTQSEELEQARSELTALGDRLTQLEGELAAAAARNTSLEESLQEARQALSEQPETIVDTDGQPVQQVEELQRTLSEMQISRDTVRAELEEAIAQRDSLEAQLAALRETRDLTEGESADLRQEIARLTSRVAELERTEETVGQLQEAYEAAISASESHLAANRFAQARSTMLNVLSAPRANPLPGFAERLTNIHEEIVQQAAAESRNSSRDAALEQVTELATEVQKNITGPRDAPSVRSYLRRVPDLGPVADEIFEIVELSARALEAAEAEFLLLGSVSRITGNLMIVERLVRTPAAVGDRVEIRRTPELGQEVPVGSGVVLEVSQDRIVVSVDEIFELERSPQLRDIVYVAQ